jgi:L-rhamnose mutarotase
VDDLKTGAESSLKQGYLTAAAGPTRRYCQTLRLNPATLRDYRHWHSPRHIWPEIPEGIRRAGILDMEIYVAPGAEETNETADMDAAATTAAAPEPPVAVMILTVPVDFDWDAAFGAIAGYERQAEWEAFVAPFQLAAGGRSDEKWRLCERIFALADCT